MDWRERLTSCENFLELNREYQSICWSSILNNLCPYEGCDYCPVAILYDDLKHQFLGDS